MLFSVGIQAIHIEVLQNLGMLENLLSQVPYCIAISQKLKANASKALKALNRFPVLEVEDLYKEQIESEIKFNPATKRSNHTKK